MLKWYWLIFLIFTFLLQPLLSYAGPFSFTFDGTIVSLQAERSPLRDILKRFSEHGVRVKIDPAINPAISGAYFELPVERVLSSILKSYDHTLGWKKVEVGGEAELVLSEIQIFQQGQQSRVVLLEESDTLKIETGPGGIEYVKNRLLVKLKLPVDAEELEKILGDINGFVVESFPDLGVFRIHLRDDADPVELAESLSKIEAVVSAEPDYAYKINGAQKIAENADFPELKRESQDFESALIAVLDSGLQPGYVENPAVRGVYDAFGESALITDSVGHGTQMSLVAAGIVSPLGLSDGGGAQTPIVSVRSFDDNGYTSNVVLLRSIDYALAADAQIVSMSWGAEHSSEMLESVVAYAADNGLIMIAAAGNNPTGVPVYPAASSSVIGVGALMPDGSIWDQSNYGDFVSVYAPGVAQMPVGHEGDAGIYAGTSIATAYIANKVAQLKAQHPDADVEKILTLLQQASKPLSH